MEDRAVTERFGRKGRITLRIPFPGRRAFCSSLSAIDYHNDFTCTVSSSVSHRKQALNGWTVSCHCCPQRKEGIFFMKGRKQLIWV